MVAATDAELPTVAPDTGSTDPADMGHAGEAVYEPLTVGGRSNASVVAGGGTLVSMSMQGRLAEY